MKRIFTCALAGVLALSLFTGCGKEIKPNDAGSGSQSGGSQSSSTQSGSSAQGSSSASKDNDGSLDLNKIYQTLLDMQTNEDQLVMFESDDMEIDNFYPGLNDIAFKQKVCYMAAVTGFATEILMVETENSSDVKKVQDIFQKRIDDAASDTGYPETAAIWQKNAQIQTKGNYVCMIVLPDGYTIPDDIFSIAE